LAENTIINYCYGQMPGNSKPDYIIFGTESSWENKVKLKSGINKDYCGYYSSRQSLSVAYKEYSNSNGGTVHMTIIFNVFVIYTLFNQINCRVIDDSFNIFVRINRSLLFPLICLLEMGLQVAIIFIGKSPFHIVNDGLTGVQWGICLGLSAITFVVSFIVKLIPLQICIDKYLEPKEEEIDDSKDKIDDMRIVEPNDSEKKFDITQRKSKRYGSNRLINRESGKKNSYRNSNKNVTIYS